MVEPGVSIQSGPQAMKRTSLTVWVASAPQILKAVTLVGLPDPGFQDRPFYQVSASCISRMNFDAGCITEQVYDPDDLDIPAWCGS